MLEAVNLTPPGACTSLDATRWLFDWYLKTFSPTRSCPPPLPLPVTRAAAGNNRTQNRTKKSAMRPQSLPHPTPPQDQTTHHPTCKKAGMNAQPLRLTPTPRALHTSVITCAASFLDWMPRYHRRRFPAPPPPDPDVTCADVDFPVLANDGFARGVGRIDCDLMLDVSR